ncbi:MAG TPA: hypothetical protein DCS93_17420 [Microscillaceae bacterium]|nr:hypothetical protein [Microscillaceae bacterium]
MKIFSFLSLLMVGIFVFTGCSNNFEEPQSKQTNLIDQIIEQGANIDPKAPLYNAYYQLNDQELPVFFHKMSEVIAKGQSSNDISTQQIEELTYYRFVKLNLLAKEQFQRAFNQLTMTEQDQLIDNHIEEASQYAIVQSKLWSAEQYQRTQQNITRQYENARTASCPGYVFGISTHKSNRFNKHCLGYYNVRHSHETDCDYEFRFQWPHPFTPGYSLELTGTSWAALQIVKLGNIGGRIAGSEVRFIIGKGRTHLFYPISGPGGLSGDLKSYL